LKRRRARFAIFSTYEFEPVHFEKYLLWTKALGRARRIIVMADAGRFQKLLAECRTAARSLNQHYLVVPIRRPAGFFMRSWPCCLEKITPRSSAGAIT
jgi:hypothetical protein